MVKTSITCRIQICVFRSRFVARCIHELLAIADIVISKFGTLELCWELWCYSWSSTSNESVSSRPGGLITAEALACGLMMDTLPCFLRAVLPMRFWRLEGTFKENRCQRLRRPKVQTGTFGLNKRTFDACFAVTQTMWQSWKTKKESQVGKRVSRFVK